MGNRLSDASIAHNITMRNSAFDDQKEGRLQKRPPRPQSAQGWFLTYPKCDLSKEEAIKILQAQDGPLITEYVIARELHQDGEPHLHAFVRYASKVTWGANRWDLMTQGPPGKIYHGNYQVARSWANVQKYCQKGGDFIANFCTQAALAKRAARNKQLLEGNIKDMVDSGIIGLIQVKAVQQARNLYAQLVPALDRPSTCGIWVFGAPGVGKSHWVRSQEPSLFLKSQSKWWDGYNGQTAVLIDDLDSQGSCLFHYLKIWADKWACTGEVKGDTIPLNYERFYVTSNFKIEEIFKDQPLETVKAIRRRFKVIHMIRNMPKISDLEEEFYRGPLDN